MASRASGRSCCRSRSRVPSFELPGLARVDAAQVADALAVFLAYGDVHAVLVETPACRSPRWGPRAGVLDRLAVLELVLGRVAVVASQDLLEHAQSSAVLHRRRLVGVQEAVAAAENDQALAVHAPSPGGPVAVHDAAADLPLFSSPGYAAPVRLEGHEARRLRGGDVHVRPVLAVAGGGVDLVAHDQHVAVGDVVGRRPARRSCRTSRRCRRRSDAVASGLPGPVDMYSALVLVTARCCPPPTLGVQAHDLAAVGDDVDAVRRRTVGEEQMPRYSQSLTLPVAELWDRELPEELPGLFVQAVRSPRSPFTRGSRGARCWCRCRPYRWRPGLP